MPATKECPLCGGNMKLREGKSVVHVPGNRNATTRAIWEWVCPDCDYFEEAEEAESR
jgi:YgiT-type zinc finger domain-containing protein